MTGPTVPPAPDFTTINAQLTDTVVSAISNATPESAVLAEAPPGAGKSTLITSVAHDLVTHDTTLRLAVVTQTNEQADDIALSLRRRFPHITVARIVSGRGPSPAIDAAAGPALRVTKRSDTDDARASRVLVSTARKWEYERARMQQAGTTFPIALIDEAYQMRSDALLGISSLFEVIFSVGDPGQLDPFSVIDDSLWRGLPYSPTRTAMGTLRAFHPALTPIQLPTSWRLPPSAAGVVSTAFYPEASFGPGTTTDQRSLAVRSPSPRPGSRMDDALSKAAAGGWAYLELDEKFTVRTDDEIAASLAAGVDSLLTRGADVADELTPSGYRLGPNKVAVIAAHNDQVHAVRYQLAARGRDPDQIVISTANKIQGREYDVVFVWHPLAGRRDATAFHLEAGRMCVMLSRHRHAAIVVGRAGADRLLSEFPDSDPMYLEEPETFPDGWQANHDVLHHLLTHRV